MKTVKQMSLPSFDATWGLTKEQKTEVIRRIKEEPRKPIEQIVEEVKKWFNETRKVQGLFLKKEYYERFQKLARKKGTSVKYEIERMCISKKIEEYLREHGV